MQLFVGTKAVILHEGKVLILREAPYDEGTNAGKWDVAGGRIKPEEPLLEALKREVMEESGLQISVRDAIDVSETFPVIKGESCHIVRIHYICDAVTTEVTIGADHSEYKWVSFDELGQYEFVSGMDIVFEKARKAL